MTELTEPRATRKCGGRLTASDVVEIRSGGNLGELAKRYGVTYSCVYQARHARTWKHVPDVWVPDAAPTLPATAAQIRNFPGYFIEPCGDVWSTRRHPHGVRLTSTTNSYTGYVSVGLYKGDEQKRMYIHRLLLLTFVGDPPPGKPFALHADGTRDNNVLSNLRWGSAKDNHDDSVRHGTAPHLRCKWGAGEDSPVSKLSRDEVLAIRASESTHAELADEFGVSVSTIRVVKSRKGWAHVPRDGKERPSKKHSGTLHEDQVREILRATGASGVELAAMYGVSESAISRIRARISWAWVEEA
jgi:hypothetical protein